MDAQNNKSETDGLEKEKTNEEKCSENIEKGKAEQEQEKTERSSGTCNENEDKQTRQDQEEKPDTSADAVDAVKEKLELQEEKEKKKQSAIKAAILGCLLIIIILLIILLLKSCGSTNNDNRTGFAGVELTIDENQGEIKESEVVTKEDAPGAAIPGWGMWVIPANETEIYLPLYNPEKNEGWYYLTFEITVPTGKETDGVKEYKTIYQSGLIEPGKAIERVVLKEPLKQGKYDAIIIAQPYTMNSESPEPSNNAEMKTLIVAE